MRENRDEVTAYLLDQDLMPRLVTRDQPDGGRIAYAVAGEKLDALRPVLTIPFADIETTHLEHLTADGRACYLTTSIGRDRAALFRVDIESGAQTLVAEHAKADIASLLIDPRSREVVAAVAEHERKEWIAVDPRVATDLAWLGDEIRTGFHVDSQSADGAHWIIAGSDPVQPAIHYLFERGARRLTQVFAGDARFFSGNAGSRALQPGAHDEPHRAVARPPRPRLVRDAARERERRAPRPAAADGAQGSRRPLGA
jgi:hypothetical protein